jgi:hypothetical protein
MLMSSLLLDPDSPIWPAPPGSHCPDCPRKALPFRVESGGRNRIIVSVRCPTCKREWSFVQPSYA